MQFYYHQHFKTDFRCLARSVQKKLLRQLEILSQGDIPHSTLAVHPITTPEDGIWELRLQEYRVTFIMNETIIVLRRIAAIRFTASLEDSREA
jgi:mRNA-degrading endonuclease RelE of RelBE toxin-antitoxin system